MSSEQTSIRKNVPSKGDPAGVLTDEIEAPRPTESSASSLRVARLDPRRATPARVRRLQRTVGNHATMQLLNPAAVQRLNGATPVNFAALGAGATEDNDTCTIKHQLTWASSTGQLADLSDHTTREHITFNHNPITDMPCYGGPLPFGMALAGNVLTKTVAAMNFPGGADEHSGAGNGTAFRVGGAANLTKGAWTLIGTQHYQVSNDGGATWNNVLGPFIITRTMAQNGNRYTLTITKTGPGLNLAAGPTNIYDVLTSEAIANVGAAAPDQTGGWNMADQNIQNAGLQYVHLGTDNLVSNGNPIAVRYEKTHPNNPAAANMAPYILPNASRQLVLSEARSAVQNILGRVTNMPPRIIVTIIQGQGYGLPAQQAFQTNENGGTYRVLLRADKMMDTTLHILGSQTGEKARKAWTKKGRKEIYSKQAMTHESGHLLHGFTNPNMYKIGTMSQMNYIADATDPLDAEKAQLSRINTDIMMELNQRPYTAEWNYAKDPMQANPAEVVAEVFTALMNRRRNIPRGLAAVYLAYGGMRSPQIDALLTHIFGGNIPTLTQPQYAIPLIQND